jgi:hypothetical protein
MIVPPAVNTKDTEDTEKERILVCDLCGLCVQRRVSIQLSNRGLTTLLKIDPKL